MTDARATIRPLTSIRGFAALWVYVHHARNLSDGSFARAATELGYFGVDVFFILSGFIISYIHIDDFLSWADLKKNTRRFLTLRLFRIYPLHLITLLLLIAFPVAAYYDPGSPTAVDFIENLLMVHAWGFPVVMCWNIPSWSISTEWLLYLLFPLMAWGIGSRARDPLFNVLLLLLALWGWVTYLYAIDWEMPYLWWSGYSVPRGILDFTMGVALHNLFRAGFLGRLPWDAISIMALLGVIIVIWLKSRDIEVYGVVMLALFAVTIYAFANLRSFGNWLFSNRVVVYLGTISYSLYMFHWQYLQVTWQYRSVLFHEESLLSPQFAAKTLGLIGLSALSYHFIENPARKWGQRLAGRAA